MFAQINPLPTNKAVITFSFEQLNVEQPQLNFERSESCCLTNTN